MHLRTRSPSLLNARDGYLAWLATSRDLSPHSIRAYRSDLRALASFAGEQSPSENLTPALLQSFFAQQKAGGLKASSLRRRAAGISGFCAWLHASGHVSTNPWGGVDLGFRRERSLPKAVPRHEIAALLRHLRAVSRIDSDDPARALRERPNEAAIFIGTALMVATGIRVGELVSIRLTDVDLPDCSIRILGKGRRERLVFLPNHSLSELLERYTDLRSQLTVAHDRLLYNATGASLSTDFVRRELRSAAAAAGLSRHLTPHMLRHTAATQLIESGVDIRFVQRLLGHASLSTTEIYTHISDQALRQALRTADVLRASGALGTPR